MKDHTGPYGTIMDHNGQHWTTWDHIGPYEIGYRFLIYFLKGTLSQYSNKNDRNCNSCNYLEAYIGHKSLAKILFFLAGQNFDISIIMIQHNI